MKFTLLLVIALPLVMAAPHKKALDLSSNPFVNSLLNVFHVDELKQLVTDLVDDLGSDARLNECQNECDHLVDTQFSAGTVNTLSHTACPLACHSLQELAHFFHVKPSTTTTATPSV
ncbi:uncharacterized protein [Argopecten irradians]|uniref:uncharacterized protein n=1 Tax=Argopecten irradians TaxID=31199 RepID=UPI00371D64DD